MMKKKKNGNQMKAEKFSNKYGAVWHGGIASALTSMWSIYLPFIKLLTITPSLMFISISLNSSFTL